MPDALQRLTDADDARFADYAALTDAQLRKRYEREHGVLIAEGPQPVRRLVESRYPVRSLLLAEERVGAMHDVVAALAARNVPIYVVARDLLYEVVRFRLHQGVIACGGRLPPDDPEALIAGAARMLVLEGLGDHENLGALMRTARGLGVEAVLLASGCADPLYRRSIRVSMGHVLHVPFAFSGPIDVTCARLASAGVVTVALSPSAPVELASLGFDVDVTRRHAVLLGAEGPGLTTTALDLADRRVRIDMADGVDSLNVAAAAAIAMYALRG